MADEEFSDRYWRAQLYVALWPLWMILYFPLIFANMSIDNRFLRLITLFAFLLAILMGAAMIVAHFGLIFDGRAIKKSNQYEWRPWWWSYFIFSFLIGVYFVAPIYLLQRWRHTGHPNFDDVKRKFSIRGVLVPWH